MQRQRGTVRSRPQGRASVFKEAMPAHGHGRIVESTPARRIGTPDDIAEFTCFLLSDAAGFITGQTCVAAGGLVTLP